MIENLPMHRLRNLLMRVSYFLLIYGVVLFIHIIFSFQYIKKYHYLFQNEKN